MGGPTRRPATDGLVGVTGDTGLDSVLDVEGLALAAVGAQLLAVAELTARGRPVARVALDAPHIGVSFRSERFLRVDGRPAGAGFAPLSRSHRAVDGWVRLHANYPWHRRAAPAALGADPAAAIAERNALEVENAVVAAGGVVAAVRTPAQWATSPQGRSLAGRPFIDLHRVGAASPRRRTLTGLRVLDLTRVIAGPVATRTLASHGAAVLQVDSPRLLEDPDRRRHTHRPLPRTGGRQPVRVGNARPVGHPARLRLRRPGRHRHRPPHPRHRRDPGRPARASTRPRRRPPARRHRHARAQPHQHPRRDLARRTVPGRARPTPAHRTQLRPCAVDRPTRS